MLAAIATAGLRIVVQANITITTASENSYTITSAATRRAMVIHNSTAAFDIRFERNGTAVATDFPILPQFYFAVDCTKDDTLSFYNANAGSQTVYILELE
jgi:hypothetical protein